MRIGVAGKLVAGRCQFRTALRGDHLLLLIVRVDENARNVKRPANTLVFQYACALCPGGCGYIVECEGDDRFGCLDPSRRSRKIAYEPVIDPVRKCPDFLRHA